MRKVKQQGMRLERRLKLMGLSIVLFIVTIACSLFRKSDRDNGQIMCYVPPEPTETPEVMCYEIAPETSTPTPMCYTATPPPMASPTPLPESRDELREKVLAAGRLPESVARVLRK